MIFSCSTLVASSSFSLRDTPCCCSFSNSALSDSILCTNTEISSCFLMAATITTHNQEKCKVNSAHYTMKAQSEMEMKLRAFLSLTAKTGLLSSFFTICFSYNLLYQILLKKSTAWSLTTSWRWYVIVVTKRWSIITLCCAGLYYLDRSCHSFFNRQIGQNGCHSFQVLVLWIYFSGVYKMNRNQNNDQFVFVFAFVCVAWMSMQKYTALEKYIYLLK